MSQFQPPPPPPDAGMPQTPIGDAYDQLPPERPPLSVAALMGFISSLLGCVIVPAVLGLILGIVGIMRTSGGVRRGRGLAIAAIPISLVMGAIGCTLLFAFSAFLPIMQLTGRLPTLLSGADAAAAVMVRESASADFRDQVSEDDLIAWFEAWEAKHGKFVVLDGQPSQSTGPDETVYLDLPGKFINGTANIRLVIRKEGAMSYALDDIEVGGLSPRGAAAEKSGAHEAVEEEAAP